MLPKTRPRILCVDNDEDSRMMLVTLFRLALVEAKAVGTAAQALSLIESEHFDLYVLDAWLPEIDGFELCRRMRALHPPTPILFFSGAAYEADKRRGIEAGANAYVTKPDIDEMVARVKEFMSGDESQPVTRAIARWEVVTSTPARVENLSSSLAQSATPSGLLSLAAGK